MRKRLSSKLKIALLNPTMMNLKFKSKTYQWKRKKIKSIHKRLNHLNRLMENYLIKLKASKTIFRITLMARNSCKVSILFKLIKTVWPMFMQPLMPKTETKYKAIFSELSQAASSSRAMKSKKRLKIRTLRWFLKAQLKNPNWN